MPVEKIPRWTERLLLPKLSEISADIKSTNIRIEALESKMNTRIDSLESNMSIWKYSLDDKIGSLELNMSTRMDSLEKRIPVIEEITALKLKIVDMEKRLAVA